MELSQQVCSLESAKRLKELGVKQDSYFDWHECSYSSAGNKRWWLLDHQGDLCILDSCSAFTVAELGVMLPDGHGTWQFRFGKNHRNTGWHGRHIDNGDTFGFFNNTSPTEAEARAKMLIYLLENKLI